MLALKRSTIISVGAWGNLAESCQVRFNMTLCRSPLGANGTLVINDAAGNNDADGNIVVGVDATPLQPVKFDGSILIKDNGAGAYGDLVGDLDIFGCHETSADLDVCVCGSTIGTISISQHGCANQVVHSCVSGCP